MDRKQAFQDSQEARREEMMRQRALELATGTHAGQAAAVIVAAAEQYYHFLVGSTAK